MKIFYLKKDKFLENFSRQELEKFSDGRLYGSDEKYIEHLCGIFLTKFAAKKYFKIEDTEIIYKDKKPCFKSGEINFSISHSKNIVLVGFSDKNIGVDVEFMDTSRDFQKLSKRYNFDVKNLTMTDFYKFWTVLEAEIKLGKDLKSKISLVLDDNYMLSCVTEDENIKEIETIKEIKSWT